MERPTRRPVRHLRTRCEVRPEADVLPHPFYCLSPDGRWAYTPDFRRLNDTRPGYGYGAITDPNKSALAPENSGIWRMDMQTGDRRLIVSLADAAKIPFTGKADAAFNGTSKHWFNHLLCNTDGSRLFFLHRWRTPDRGGFKTRAFTMNPEGGDLFLLDPHGETSHFVWRDPRHVFAWAWHPSHGNRFYLYEDKTDHVEVVGKDVMTQNGHNTYVPGTRNEWVLNDTYPDVKGFQHPYLYHVPTDRRVPLGDFLSPPPIAASGDATTTLAQAGTARKSCSTRLTVAAARSTSWTSARSPPENSVIKRQ